MHPKAIVDFYDFPATFYVRLNKKTLHNIFTLLKEKYKTWNRIRKRFGVYIDNRIFKGRYVSITLLFAILRDLDIDFESIRPSILSIKSGDRGLPLPNCLPVRSSPELAALIAHAMGDGTITHNRFEYTNTRPELITKVSKHVRLIFKFDKPYMRALRKGDYKPAFKLLYPASIGRMLELAGAPKGNKTEKEFLVPSWICKGSSDIKRAFLRALFDDEGSVTKLYTLNFSLSKRARFRNNLNTFLRQLQKMFEEFGIDNSRIVLRKKVPGTIMGELLIGNLLRVEKFEKQIGFTHIKRKERLHNLLKIKKRVYKKGESESLILSTLAKNPLSTSAVAKAIKRDRSTAYRWLSSLKRKGKVKILFPKRRKTEITWALSGFKGNFIPEHDAYHTIPVILNSKPYTASEIAKQTKVGIPQILKYLKTYESIGKVERVRRTRRGILWAPSRKTDNI